MGNCQAMDAATLVLQHPSGKLETMYWPITANEVMKMNPGHYVSLIITFSGPENKRPTATDDQKKTVRYTRVKLLRPTDTLVLGRAYRLLTSQEVKKVRRAKMLAKTKMNDKIDMNQGKEKEGERLESENNDQVLKHEKQRLRSGSMNSRSKTWRPSLQSISEGAS